MPLLLIGLFLNGCASTGGSKKATGVKYPKNKGHGSNAKDIKKKSSLLDSLPIKKEFMTADKEKIKNIKENLKSALDKNDGEQVEEELKGLAGLKIVDNSINDYKKAYKKLSDLDTVIDKYDEDLAKQNQLKNAADTEYGKINLELGKEEKKLKDLQPILKNFASTKNTDPLGKTKKLNKAIEDNNYLEMIRLLKELKLVNKDEEKEHIDKYKGVEKNIAKTKEVLNKCDSKRKNIDKQIEKLTSEKQKKVAEEIEVEQKFNEEKAKLKQFVDDKLEGKLKEQAESNSDLQKKVDINNIKLSDNENNKVVSYEYVGKGKSDKSGSLIGVKVKRLIHNPLSQNNKNYMFKFAANDFKKNDDGLVASKDDKVIKVKYKIKSPNSYIFEWEDGYSGEAGPENVAKLSNKYNVLLSGSTVNLSYSDFGCLDETAVAKSVNGDQIKTFNKFKTFVGGYDEKNIDISKVTLNEEVKYSGKIIGRVSNTNTSKNEKLSGSVSLTLNKDKTEDININFKDYYDLKFKSKAFDNSVNDLTVQDKRTGEKYKDYTIDNTGNGTFSKKYYGDNPKQAGSETVGRFNYNQGTTSIDTVFGAKKE